METILWYTVVICMIAVIAINLVLPCALRRTMRSDRARAISRLYGLHYQRRNSLTSDKR